MPAFAAKNPTTVLRDAVKKTETQKTAHAQLKINISGAASPTNPDTNFTQTGVFDLKKPNGVWKVDNGTDPYNVRLVNGVYYFGYIGLPATQPWVRSPVTEYSQYFGIQDGIGDGTTILESLNLLNATTGTVKKLGSTKVRDISTTEYRATVDIEKFFKNRDYFSDTAKAQMRQFFGEKFPLLVWIDSKGRARRIAYQVDLSKQSNSVLGAAGKVTLSLEFWDFGTKLNVTAPPQDQTMTFDQYQNLGGNSQPNQQPVEKPIPA